MNWIAHHLRLGGWIGRNRGYVHESKNAVRRYVCRIEVAQRSVSATAHGRVRFATPFERREALQQQRRVEVASKLIKINRSTEIGNSP